MPVSIFPYACHVPQSSIIGDADVVIGERRFERSQMPASRYHANRIGSRALSWFIGVPAKLVKFDAAWQLSQLAVPLGM